ncbi:MAG TPA: SIMPL domain-containing protein [Cyclobacteriaceae bacterium]|nr:SIMPL domain-containing protein [Cyclobacteriaceae bacterium]
MRQLAFFVIILVNTNLFGQTEKNIPSIEVVGVSRKMVTPDVAILAIAISNKDMNFAQTSVGLNDKTKDVAKQIMSAGFRESDIKTTDYQIRVNRIYRKDSWIDSGYVASQNVRVEFKYSKDMVSKILTTFSKSKTAFDLQFDFKLSDDLKSKVSDDLIKMAVKDAKDKAKILSESAGVKLKQVIDINYNGNSSPDFRPYNEAVSYKARMSDQAEPLSGFTPVEIQLNDSVVMKWEIE